MHITALGLSVNSGDDMAGTIHALGPGVEATGEFHLGDRVAAFHPMLTPGGAYAEYAVAPSHTVFIIPANIKFEEAATIPLVTLTAAVSLFRRQALPAPWSARSDHDPPIPLIVYGASSALGSFAVKLAKLANIHPIIAIAGGSQDYVSGLLDPSKGDTIVDYRLGVDAMTAAVEASLGHLKALHALDAISAHGTWIPLTRLVDPQGGQVSVVSGANRYNEAEIPSGVSVKYTYVGTVHYGAYKAGMPKQPEDLNSVNGDVDFAYVLLRYVGRLLARGDFEGHPAEVIPGGLNGIELGLRRLKAGNARGVKLVYRIGDTEAL